jgi:hypothetical protein
VENRVENLEKERYRWLGKLLHCPVRDTVRVRKLADLKISDGFLNFVGVDCWFVGRGHEVEPHRHVHHLNNCRDRGNGHRLKLSVPTVGKGFGFLSLRDSPRGDQGEMELKLSSSLWSFSTAIGLRDQGI